MKQRRLLPYLFLVLLASGSCTQNQPKEQPGLPYLGNKIIEGSDTIYPVIPAFSFKDQEARDITNATFRGNIYVADFIFLNCTSICPIMNVQMDRVYNRFINNPDILFLSHSIDPERDTIAALKAYADARNYNPDRWHFVTGSMDSIRSIASSYYAVVYKDAENPGDYIHSGGFMLVDREGHIRGIYDGTDSTQVNQLIKDIDILLKSS